MQADLIIVNGKCNTMTDEGFCDWIAVKGEMILKTGKGDEYRTLKGSETLIIDAGGGTVLPGFIDSHFHVVQTAMNLQSVQMKDAGSWEGLGRKIRETEMEHPGKPIMGVRLEKERLKENRFPDRKVLDRFSENVPVWINCLDYQISMLNTYGLLYYKIPFRMEGVETDSNGVATGIFRGKANAMLRTNVLNRCSDDMRHKSVEQLMPRILRYGITTINAMEGGYMYSDRDAEFIHEYSGDFPVDITLFYQSMDMNKINAMGLNRVGGSMYLDGTMGARTAALTFEYADRPGEMGNLTIGQNELNEFLVSCYQRHCQTALYTIGDRAIGQALRAHEYAIEKTGISGLRHRLEHVELATKDQIRKAAELGIIFSMNPTYEKYWGAPGEMYQKRLGARYGTTNQYRMILDEGVMLCAGSDSDICEIDPMIGISAAVNHPVARHRITLQEALRMYTINGAYAIGEEDRKGSLKEGHLADIIIMNCDLETLPAEKLEDAKVKCTIKSGGVVYNELL